MRQLSKLDRLTQKRVPMKRRRYTKEFKAKVALEANKGPKTANELASEFRVHVSQINNWKKQPLDGLAQQGFNRKDERREAAYEAEKDRLYRQIGKLAGGGGLAKKKSSLCTLLNQALYVASPANLFIVDHLAKISLRACLAAK
jgi:transposase